MLWRTLPKKEEEKTVAEARRYPSEPQENLLYFMEKNAPLLESWQREVLRIVRKVSQYFYPQKQTQVMNEGWATFWHYTILNHLYDEGKVTERFMLEFLHSHTNVVFQPPYNSPWYSGINPYALGLPCSRYQTYLSVADRGGQILVPGHSGFRLAGNLAFRDARFQR